MSQIGILTPDLVNCSCSMLLPGVKELPLDSVANAAVYPPNWATLKSSAAGQKNVGQVA